jgi:hypothetical protein
VTYLTIRSHHRHDVLRASGNRWDSCNGMQPNELLLLLLLLLLLQMMWVLGHRCWRRHQLGRWCHHRRLYRCVCRYVCRLSQLGLFRIMCPAI